MLSLVYKAGPAIVAVATGTTTIYTYSFTNLSFFAFIVITAFPGDLAGVISTLELRGAVGIFDTLYADAGCGIASRSGSRAVCVTLTAGILNTFLLQAAKPAWTVFVRSACLWSLFGRAGKQNKGQR